MSVLIMKMLSPLVTEPTFNHSRAVHYNCPAGNYKFKRLSSTNFTWPNLEHLDPYVSGRSNKR